MPATTLQATIRYTPPGIRQYYWLATPPAGATPTLAELNAGTDITSEVVDGGVSGFSKSPSTVDAPDVGTKITKKARGRTTLSDSSLALYLSEDGNDSRTLFTDGEQGAVVIFPEGNHTGLLMDVWPVEVLTATKDQDTTKVAQITVSFSHYAVPVENHAIPTV